MRRIYYRYPQRVDLSFAMGMTFPETLKYIAELNGQESTKTTGKELVRMPGEGRAPRQTGLNSATSLPMSCAPASSPRLPISGSRCLRLPCGDRKIPVANDVFFVRLTDRNTCTDIDIARQDSGEGLDALDMKNILLGKSN